MSIFSWQLQPSIRLLFCAMPWRPCCLYPASPVWMTADKSPRLLLASLCNSTAGECAFSYEAHCHKSTKHIAANPGQIALSSRDISFDILLTETIVTILTVCYLSYCISSLAYTTTDTEAQQQVIRLVAASNTATLIMRFCIKIS